MNIKTITRELVNNDLVILTIFLRLELHTKLKKVRERSYNNMA